MTFSATKFLVGVAAWSSGTPTPTTDDAVGSIYLQAGVLPATPVALHYKLAAGAAGWARQNLVGLKVFNVKFYGATGDGVTDDTVAVTAAITAANAAGGGIVYFPRGTYRSTRVAGTSLASYNLINVHNITFMGDGYCSMLQMNGSAGGADWHMFRIHNASSRIRFHNLRLDGSLITNPDPGEQNHLVLIQGQATDTSGVFDIEFEQVWFTTTIGDCLRHIGEAGKETVNVRTRHCAFNIPNTRSAVNSQRFTRRCQVHYNWMAGSSDSELHWEMSGASGVDIAAPEEWSIVGNHILHSANGSAAFVLLGVTAANTAPVFRDIFAYNNIDNGTIFAEPIKNAMIKGNVVVYYGTVDLSNQSPIWLGQEVSGCEIIANICTCLTPQGPKPIISLTQGGGFAPTQNVVADNVGSTVMTATASGILFDSCQQTICIGNIVQFDTTVASVCLGINFAATTQEGDQNLAIGNLVVCTTAKAKYGIQFSSNGQNTHNCQAAWNFIRHADRVIGFARSAAELFLDWRLATGNNGVDITTVNIDVPGTNVGVTAEGNAGPGAQMAIVSTTPGGNVSAPKGSTCVNTAGGQATTLYYKESGVGVSGGTAGWASDGPSEMIMGAASGSAATAARFLGPGLGLAAESATEIQVPVTRSGTVRNMRLRCVVGVGNANNTYTLRKNGVNTGLSVVIANNVAQASDLVHSTTVVAGDLLSIQVTKAGVPTSPQTQIAVSFEITG